MTKRYQVLSDEELQQRMADMPDPMTLFEAQYVTKISRDTLKHHYKRLCAERNGTVPKESGKGFYGNNERIVISKADLLELLRIYKG